jgi:hypothetical protein
MTDYELSTIIAPYLEGNAILIARALNKTWKKAVEDWSSWIIPSSNPPLHYYNARIKSPVMRLQIAHWFFKSRLATIRLLSLGGLRYLLSIGYLWRDERLRSIPSFLSEEASYWTTEYHLDPSIIGMFNILHIVPFTQIAHYVPGMEKVTITELKVSEIPAKLRRQMILSPSSGVTVVQVTVDVLKILSDWQWIDLSFDEDWTVPDRGTTKSSLCSYELEEMSMTKEWIEGPSILHEGVHEQFLEYLVDYGVPTLRPIVPREGVAPNTESDTAMDFVKILYVCLRWYWKNIPKDADMLIIGLSLTVPDTISNQFSPSLETVARERLRELSSVSQRRS